MSDAVCQLLSSVPLQVFLYPIGGILVALPFAVLTGFNPTKLVLEIYFNRQ